MSQINFGRTIPVILRRFPKYHAKSLTGTKLVVPEELAGRVNFILLGFKKGHNKMMDKWWNFAKGLHVRMHEKYGDKDTLQYYKIILKARRARLIAWYHFWRYRSFCLDDDMEARTLFIFSHRETFIDSMALPDCQRPYVMIIRRNGEIDWCDHEEPNVAKMNRLLDDLGIPLEEREAIEETGQAFLEEGEGEEGDGTEEEEGEIVIPHSESSLGRPNDESVSGDKEESAEKESTPAREEEGQRPSGVVGENSQNPVEKQECEDVKARGASDRKPNSA
uniref:Thioredoxin-like fold domain-containing protein n=1 Tax=Chromera velia CCMP2878 TaxID=1169474 RepID=A0A0G4FRK8_9ALVE|eukprot:Cvel_18416.t1-p1 / transcript=Cvel_18416.t1 / gene=Cvel_18416 / organism=Chromera_velia_CCMP2878 / gene_product=hypothetical protein / transcript_product=hypothetical protein / location=Cvel_scaffold1523:35858-36688(-) / protein_length=277 / sequence_SO=supercontig / SO=protein_coding / is_pseudo=false